MCRKVDWKYPVFSILLRVIKRTLPRPKNQLESALNIEREVTVSVVDQGSPQTSDLASAHSTTVRNFDDGASLC